MLQVLNFSVIIPVYNRVNELREALESLALQTDKNFETIVVDDGSQENFDTLIAYYKTKLNLKFYQKPNTGPGLTRNMGMEKAQGNYFIFIDSDAIAPPHYIEFIRKELTQNYTDCYGGSDKADKNFTLLQKAINYSMTSFFTTGGVRGGFKNTKKFQPRSFSMGVSKKVFQTTKGFPQDRLGEDIDFSIRIRQAGFSIRLIPEAFVYHKRRTNLKKFSKQTYNWGTARIALFYKYPQEINLKYLIPAAFLIGNILLLLLSSLLYSILPLIPIIIFIALIFTESLIKNKNIVIALLSIITTYVQLCSYGFGLIRGYFLHKHLKQ